MHRFPKQLLEALAVSSGAAAFFRHVNRDRRLILAYHNVVPDEAGPCGDASLHLLRARFAQHLDCLVRTHDVVPLSQLLGKQTAGSRPRVAITLDDSYAGAVTLGLEELARRDLPATVFVPSGLLGGQAMWWDLLAEVEGGSIPPAQRRRMLVDHHGDGEAVLRLSSAQYAQSRIPWYARTADEPMLEKAIRQAGIDLADHTWSHRDLAQCSDEDVSAELRRSRESMKEKFPGSLPILAYPYGSCLPRVKELVRSAGYQYALLVDGGWISRTDYDSFAIPRINIAAGVSRNGFKLRVSGLPL